MEESTAALGPAAVYEHDHPALSEPILEQQSKTSFGARVADSVAAGVGSWPFIIIQSCILSLWIAANIYLLRHPEALKAWDPYPFILLNLVLSFQAAYTGPVVMMSQNRQSEKDRLTAQHDYEVDRKAEEELEVVMKHLVHQDRLLLDAMSRLEALQVTPPVQKVADRLEAALEQMERNDQRIVALMERIENLAPKPSAAHAPSHGKNG